MIPDHSSSVVGHDPDDNDNIFGGSFFWVQSSSSWPLVGPPELASVFEIVRYLEEFDTHNPEEAKSPDTQDCNSAGLVGARPSGIGGNDFAAFFYTHSFRNEPPKIRGSLWALS